MFRQDPRPVPALRQGHFPLRQKDQQLVLPNLRVSLRVSFSLVFSWHLLPKRYHQARFLLEPEEVRQVLTRLAQAREPQEQFLLAPELFPHC